VTPAEVIELRTALDTRRRELGRRWWEVAVEADLTPVALQRMAYGTASPRTLQAVQAWLHRHTALPRTSHEIKQGGTGHDSSGSGDG
jgi:hypothetical protein